MCKVDINIYRKTILGHSPYWKRDGLGRTGLGNIIIKYHGGRGAAGGRNTLDKDLGARFQIRFGERKKTVFLKLSHSEEGSKKLWTSPPYADPSGEPFIGAGRGEKSPTRQKESNRE